MLEFGRSLVRVERLRSIDEVTASSEAIAIVEFNPAPVHLLTTDVIMPEMNGRTLYEDLRKLRPGIKVVFMSGYSDEALGARRAAGRVCTGGGGAALTDGTIAITSNVVTKSRLNHFAFINYISSE